MPPNKVESSVGIVLIQVMVIEELGCEVCFRALLCQTQGGKCYLIEQISLST